MFYNKGHWSVRSTTNKNFLKAQSVDSREDNNFRASQNVTWQDRDILDEDLTISALHNIDSGEENEEIGFDYKSKYGRVDADLAHDKAKTSYNSNLQFSLVTNNTDFAFGGREFRRSAVLVNVEGDKGSKGSFDVSTGSSARENAKVRAKTPIALSPFRNYKISLTPSKETLADFNEQTQEIGLMPGNVVTVTWRARESAIVIGKMFYEDGSIASNVEIYSSLETSQSDDDGSFQLYSYKDDKIISHTKDSKKCEAKIPDNVDFQGNGVAFIDDIKCVVNKVEVNDLATNKPETKNPEAKDLINE
jgi:outer membrane usher protein FimD/PapC